MKNIFIKIYIYQLFNKYFREDTIDIQPNDKLQLNKSLRRKREDFTFVVPSYEQQIKEMQEWVYAHGELYPH